MWNIKALALTVQKLLGRLKFQRGGQNDRITEWQNDRMTDRTKTICPPIFDLGGIKNITEAANAATEKTNDVFQILMAKGRSFPKEFFI